MRPYTVSEIDDLRMVCEDRYLYGTTNLHRSMTLSRQYQEQDKNAAVEEMVRTYMTAGLTADDIRKQDNPSLSQNVDSTTA
jgi:hypothetical protein